MIGPLQLQKSLPMELEATDKCNKAAHLADIKVPQARKESWPTLSISSDNHSISPIQSTLLSYTLSHVVALFPAHPQLVRILNWRQVASWGEISSLRGRI